MKGIVSALLVCGIATGAFAAPALAQDNLGHFYMARQQIQILDDAPVIYDKRTQPSAAQQGAPIPRGPAPLPRAGFTPYSSSLPTGMSSGLPEVVNGVPKKIPAPAAPKISAKSAKAGAYKVKPAASPKPGSNVAKTYSPYKGYGGGNPYAQAQQSASSGNSYGTSASSATAVRGNLLHWSRTRRSGY